MVKLFLNPTVEFEPSIVHTMGSGDRGDRDGGHNGFWFGYFVRNLFGVRADFNDTIADREVMAGFFGPTAAIEVVHGAGHVGNRQVGVAAAHRMAPQLRGIPHCVGFDLLCTAKEGLALALGELGEIVGAVDPLQEMVKAICNPGDERIAGDKLVEAVAVKEEDFASAALDGHLVRTSNAKEV